MDITKYEDGFYILDDGRVREFLIIGEEEALLITHGDTVQKSITAALFPGNISLTV